MATQARMRTRFDEDMHEGLAESLGREDGLQWARRGGTENPLPGRKLVIARELQELATRLAQIEDERRDREQVRNRDRVVINKGGRDVRQLEDERDDELRLHEITAGPQSSERIAAEDEVDTRERDFGRLKVLNGHRHPPSLATLLGIRLVGYLGIAGFEQLMTADLLATTLMQPRLFTTVLMLGSGSILAFLAEAAGIHLKLASGLDSKKSHRWTGLAAIGLAVSLIAFLVGLNSGVISIEFQTSPYPDSQWNFTFGMSAPMASAEGYHSQGTSVIVGAITTLLFAIFFGISYWLHPKVPGLGTAMRRLNRAKAKLQQLERSYEQGKRSIEERFVAEKNAIETVMHDQREKLEKRGSRGAGLDSEIGTSRDQTAARITVNDAAYLRGLETTAPKDACLPTALSIENARGIVAAFIDDPKGFDVGRRIASMAAHKPVARVASNGVVPLQSKTE